MSENFRDDPEFDARLRVTLQRVQAPAGLHQRLLDLPTQANAELARGGRFLQRLLPIAAVLLVALGLGFMLQPETDPALVREILTHVYFEERYFGDGRVLSASEVEARMAPVMGTHMPQSGVTEALAVTFAKDCLIGEKRGMHLVVQGENGPVNLMMIPAHMVDHETDISDERFDGLMTPASGGTLVVVGNKHEPIRRYRDQMAHNLAWEY